MSSTLLRRAAALFLATLAGPFLASVVNVSGALDDPANSALVASDMGAAQFSDEWATANNVALYALHVSVGGSVNFNSTGYALGGIDPYVTLCSGLASASATLS